MNLFLLDTILVSTKAMNERGARRVSPEREKMRHDTKCTGARGAFASRHHDITTSLHHDLPQQHNLTFSINF